MYILFVRLQYLLLENRDSKLSISPIHTVSSLNLSVDLSIEKNLHALRSLNYTLS